MKLNLLAGTIALLFAVQGCSKPEVALAEQTSSPNTTIQQGDEQTAEQRYVALVDAYFKDYLRLEPIYATFVGVNDY